MVSHFPKYRERGAYHWIWYKTNKHLYRDYAHKIIEYFPDKGILLDIGCGDGLMAYLFFRRGLHVTGIDLDEVGINLGRKAIAKQYLKDYPWYFFRSFGHDGTYGWLESKGISLRHLSINNLPDSEKFDYALCQEVIEHVAEPRLLVNKALSVVRKYTVITTPNGDYHEPGPYDQKLWKLEELREFLGTNRTETLFLDRNRICVRLWSVI